MDADLQRSLISPTDAALAGLLHDIGKLAQRAHPDEEALRRAYAEAGRDIAGTEAAILPLRDGRYTHRHALWSDFFFRVAECNGLRWPQGINGGRVEAVAVRHHNPRHDDPSDWIIAEADRLASGLERKARDEDAELKAPTLREAELTALLPTVSIRRGVLPTERFRYAAEELSPEALLPRSPSPGDQPRRLGLLWDTWKQHFTAFAGHGLSPRRFERALLGLSERLLWAVPSSTVDQPDVSLHDHARAVAAIAAALAAWHAAHGANEVSAVRDRKIPKFRLLTLDLSGIQAALFRLAGWKGASRILRARSFLMGETIEAALHVLLDRLGLPLSVVMIQAGGKAELLAPDLPDLCARLEEVRHELDGWMVEHWQGDLALILAAGPPFAAEQFLRRGKDGSVAEGFRLERHRLAASLESAKLQPFVGWHGTAGLLGSGVIQAPFNADGACVACGVRPAVIGLQERRCLVCDAAYRIGQRIPRTDGYALLVPSVTNENAPPALPGGMRLAPWSARDADAIASIAFTRDEQGSAVFRQPAYLPVISDPEDPRYRRDEVEETETSRKGDLMTFSHIAAAALETVAGRIQGRDLLGLVKADVDFLGRVFADGLGNDRSPARVAQVSRLMDGYFGERLPWLLQREFPETYTVYAGGDDLLLIAPWRFALPLALRLQEDFSAFAGGNPNLTLSAGIAFTHPKHPLALAVEEAEEALSRAKGAGRNRCGLFTDRALTWSAVAATVDLAERLSTAVREDSLPAGVLHQMRWFAARRARAELGDTRSADWNPKWRYQQARFLGRARRDAREKLERLLLEVLPPPTRSMTADAEIATTFALWRNR